MLDSNQRLHDARANLERKLMRRMKADRFWNHSWLGVFLRRIWWHVLHPTSWPERKPTPAEIAAFREQMRNWK